MITLTSAQKAIKKRLKADIEREIGMCDDYADLMILATALYDSSKQIFSTYAQHFNQDVKNFGAEDEKKS